MSTLGLESISTVSDNHIKPVAIKQQPVVMSVKQVDLPDDASHSEHTQPVAVHIKHLDVSDDHRRVMHQLERPVIVIFDKSHESAHSMSILPPVNPVKSRLVEQSNASIIAETVSEQNDDVYNNYVMYHVILDADFHIINNYFHTNSNLRVSSIVMGQIRSVVKDHRIPVVFSLEDAKNIASRMINLCVNNGTVGNKKYPIFGAVILEITAKHISEIMRDIETNTGRRDYSTLHGKRIDLVSYERNGLKRGLLSKMALSRSQLTGAQYVVETDMSMNIGFALHNMNPLLSSDDIKILKKLYDDKDNMVLVVTQSEQTEQ